MKKKIHKLVAMEGLVRLVFFSSMFFGGSYLCFTLLLLIDISLLGFGTPACDGYGGGSQRARLSRSHVPTPLDSLQVSRFRINLISYLTFPSNCCSVMQIMDNCGFTV